MLGHLRSLHALLKLHFLVGKNKRWEHAAPVRHGEALNDLFLDANKMALYSAWERGLMSNKALDDLEDMSLRLPPFEDKEGDLWSTDSDPNSGLIWTINLNQPGMSILLGPDSEAYVRCIAN